MHLHQPSLVKKTLRRIRRVHKNLSPMIFDRSTPALVNPVVIGSDNQPTIKVTTARQKMSTPMSQPIVRCKCVVLGDGAVGKTSILNALLGYPIPFSRKYNTTRGVTISSKTLKVDTIDENNNQLMEMYFYDFSGRSIYNDLVRKLWTNNVSLVVGVFDVTQEESFQMLQTVLGDFMKQIGKNEQIVGIILGNKCDLNEQRIVSEQEAQQWSKKYRMRYLDCSAKTNHNIDDAFQHLVKCWYDVQR